MSNEACELEYEKFLDREAEKSEKIYGIIHLPLGNGNFAIVDSDCPGEIIQQKWSSNEKVPGKIYPYRTRRKSEGRTKKSGGNNSHVYLQDCICPHEQNQEVDHKNRNPQDNRRENLRVCTRLENTANRGKSRGRYTSKYKGVSRHKQTDKWRATLGIGYKQKHLGGFDSEIEAARAYDIAAKQEFGEFAFLNFP